MTENKRAIATLPRGRRRYRQHWGLRLAPAETPRAGALERRWRLPLILALQSATPADREAIERELSGGTTLGRMTEILERYNAIERAVEIGRTHARQACAHLEGLPVRDPIAFEYLNMLPEYVIARRY